MMQLAFTAQGLLPPLASAIGGIVAQEALIALTGKFSPLKQWVSMHVHTHTERENVCVCGSECGC